MLADSAYTFSLTYTHLFSASAASCGAAASAAAPFIIYKQNFPAYVFASLRQNSIEVINMAKQGMKRPDYTQVKPRNEETPVPEIQGSAKSRNEKAKPVTER